mmetsp:Transcript_82159/g.232672  ORF Transcript_82159/g.232672 Transcript_82159/m.232672 type:complete len:274 (+) Transcript_82159:1465-2286(+)
MSSALALRSAPGIFSTKARRPAAPIVSFPSLSSLKSSSALRPLACACARSAPTTAACASTATCFRAALRATICFLHFESRAPTFTFILTRALRASLNGPFDEALMESMCSLILACVFSMDCTTTSSSFSFSSSATRGLSSSEALLPASFSAAGTAVSTLLPHAATSPSTSSMIAWATFLSAASCRFFFSISMRSFIFFSDSPTFFFSWEWAYWTLLTRGLILLSSDLVSAKGPAFTDLSSSDFCSMYLETSRAESARAWSEASMRFWQALWAE